MAKKKQPTEKQVHSLKMNAEFDAKNSNGLTAEQLNSYDTIIVAFSGGKDSLGCLLEVIEKGADKSKIELWHHDVDGREGSTLMDWECTADYCRKVADAFGLPIYFSWKKGGFEGEMLREEAKTQPSCFEMPTKDGVKVVEVGGTLGKVATRRLFPQVSPDLSVRWCSAYMKIMVSSAALNNQERFLGKRTLFITGERGEESTGRSFYRKFESHTCHRDSRVKRHVDHYRPIKDWNEKKIWNIIEKFKVNPHPAYKLGWGRVSCATCIFANPNQWASIALINPTKVEKIKEYEEAFGKTIQRKLSVGEQVEKGTPYKSINKKDALAAISKNYDEPIIVENWELPSGAYGDSCGPT